jgi:RNA polymerase sigma-70 factor, ECF subfamily
VDSVTMKKPLQPMLLNEEAVDSGMELMLRVHDDVPGAFEELVERYWSRVFGRFYRLFGDRQEAEDLSQDVFLRLFRNRHRYRPDARFTTWLFHIARNVARNAIRTRRRHPVVPMALSGDAEHLPGILPRRISSEAMPSRGLELHEIAGLVREAVAGLGPRQRTAVELQIQNRTYAEIATVLRMTPKAAKSLLYRARNQLRQSLHPVVRSL